MEERVTGWRPDRERGRRNPIRDPRTFYLLSVVYGTYKGNESNRMETERDRDYSGTDGEGRLVTDPERIERDRLRGFGMDGEETIPPEGGSSALRPFPLSYPLSSPYLFRP